MISYKSNTKFSFVSKMMDVDIYIYITCMLDKTDIESSLNITLPTILFKNFNGSKNDIKSHYINDKIILKNYHYNFLKSKSTLMYTIRHTYATEQYIIGTSIVTLQN